MFRANIFRKKFIFSFIFNLWLQINTLNLHIFANKLINCYKTHVTSYISFFYPYTLLYIKKHSDHLAPLGVIETTTAPPRTPGSHRDHHRTASHPWEASRPPPHHLTPLGVIETTTAPPRTPGSHRDHHRTASHLWESSRPPPHRLAPLGGIKTTTAPPRTSGRHRDHHRTASHPFRPHIPATSQTGGHTPVVSGRWRSRGKEVVFGFSFRYGFL